MLRLIERLFHLLGSLICLIPVALPVCGVQLLLLRFCKNLAVRLIPAALGGILFVLSNWVFATHRGFYAVMALFLMVPALLLLLGSGLGWAVYGFARRRRKGGIRHVD